MEDLKKLIDLVKSEPSRSGKRELLDYLEGNLLNRKASLKAKCFQCQAKKQDGSNLCEIITCPLYPFSQFRKRSKTQGEPQNVN